MAIAILDLSAAFDTIDHNLQISILSAKFVIADIALLSKAKVHESLCKWQVLKKKEINM